MCINGDLSHGFYARPKNKSGQLVIFHKFSNKMWLSIISVVLEYAQAIRNLEGGDFKNRDHLRTLKNS